MCTIINKTSLFICEIFVADAKAVLSKLIFLYTALLIIMEVF